MNHQAAPHSSMLLGRRLLIVEEGYFLSEKSRHKLHRLGATVVGPVGDVGYAADLIETGKVDAVILDIRLDPAQAFSLVERLELLKLPYLFAIGQDSPVVKAGFTGFVLSEDAEAIEYIAAALFGRRKQDI